MPVAAALRLDGVLDGLRDHLGVGEAAGRQLGVDELVADGDLERRRTALIHRHNAAADLALQHLLQRSCLRAIPSRTAVLDVDLGEGG